MRTLRTITTSLVAASLVVAGSMSASAAPLSQTQSAGSADGQVEEQLDSVKQQLDAGESATLERVNGYELNAEKNDAGEVVFVANKAGAQQHTQSDSLSGQDEEGSKAYSGGVCVHTVTAGVFALGAGVVAMAAASGGLVVAGVFLSPAVLNLLAGAMGSYSGIQAIVAAYVC